MVKAIQLPGMNVLSTVKGVYLEHVPIQCFRDHHLKKSHVKHFVFLLLFFSKINFLSLAGLAGFARLCPGDQYEASCFFI